MTSIGIAQPLAVGAGLFAIGVLAAAFRRQPGALLRSVPVLAAGPIVALAGASRLASSNADPLAGQELAVLVAFGALGLVAAGAAALLRGAGR